MQVKAKLSYLRISPKKVRLVIDLIRGLKAEEAVTQLNFLSRAAKQPVLKLLNSAIANAEKNFNLKKDNLYIKEIRADLAGMLKRWQPRAHGRATPIQKKMSHLVIILDELVPTKVKKAKAKKEEKPIKVKSAKEIEKIIKPERIKEEKAVKPEGHEKEIDKEIHDVRMEGKHRHKQNEEKRRMKKAKGFIKKIFSRKAG